MSPERGSRQDTTKRMGHHLWQLSALGIFKEKCKNVSKLFQSAHSLPSLVPFLRGQYRTGTERKMLQRLQNEKHGMKIDL